MKTTAVSGLIALSAALILAGCAKPAAPKKAGRERVISLAPNLTEIICAIGGVDSLAGRTTACDYPPNLVSNIPAVGGFGAPSLEVMVSMKPTRVLYVDLEDKSLAQKMDNVGMTHALVPCKTLDDVPRAVLTIGGYVHREAAARELADKLTSGIAALRSRTSTNRPSVFIEIWSDPLMTAGKTSFVSELVRLAGGRNIGDEIEKEYAQVSSEWVVANKPEIVLCLGTPAKGEGRQLVLHRAGWTDIPALRNGRVYDKLSIDILTRPGPRVLDGIEELRTCISNERKVE
jgi:iron complex transport system substrate-binding protein